MKYRLFILSFFSSIALINAQSINEQVETLIEDSGNYQEYKVIKKVEILELKVNISDTLSHLDAQLNKANSNLKKAYLDLEENQLELQETIMKLEANLAVQNSIQFIGIHFSKSGFKVFIWVLMGLLLVVCLFSFARLRIGLRQVRESKDRYENLDQDFTEFRMRSLEREQKLRRENQDLVIKLRDNSK